MLVKQILDKIRNLNITEQDIDRAIRYLQTYKYLKSGQVTPGEVLDAVFKFNRNLGLGVDGFSLQTLRAMSWRRCGCPDGVVEEVNDTQKWAFNHLKYYIDSFVPGLSKEDQRAITKEAANDSSRVCGLTFEEVFNTNQANIVLTTGRTNGLGTAGEVLAYAYLPSGPNHTSQLIAVFDLADLWIKDRTKRGILYKNVAGHEIFSGHSVGLMHSSRPNALMAPVYSPDVAVPQQDDDIPRLQRRYGLPSQQPQPAPTPAPVPVPPAAKELNIKLVGDIKSIEIDGYRLYKV